MVGFNCTYVPHELVYSVDNIYSSSTGVALALDEFDAAIEKSFNDYEALGKDPNLNNL